VEEAEAAEVGEEAEAALLFVNLLNHLLLVLLRRTMFLHVTIQILLMRIPLREDRLPIIKVSEFPGFSGCCWP
jgi:hypothetical protein